MNRSNPYEIVKCRHVTEKSFTLERLKDSESNPSLKRCQTAKYVFLVHPQATKQLIKQAVEEIYKEKKVKVIAVNTITRKPKPRRVRGRLGKTSGLKKAIVTLEKGDSLDEV